MSQIHKIRISKREFEAITKVVNNDIFEGMEYFDLELETGISGIGATMVMKFPYQLDDHKGEYSIEITGTENW
jgi:hypothetical protein